MTPDQPTDGVATPARSGKIRYGLAALLLGLPVPLVLLAFLMPGCGN